MRQHGLLSKKPDLLLTSTRRRTAVAVLAGALALTVAACGSDSSSGDSKSGSSGSGSATPAGASALGTRNPASGQPIKIGFISDGRTPAFDNTAEITAANAVVHYLNDYQSGIGGRPVQLVTCESKADPAVAADCATEFIKDKVLLTVIGSTTATPYAWKPLHDANIPLFGYGNADKDLLSDRSSTFILSGTGSATDVPMGLAKEKNLKKVTVVAVDIPVATGYYRDTGAPIFKKAGIDLSVVPVPLGQADMTPEMTRVAGGGPTEVHIVGTDSFCIAAINGLRAASFTGPISIVDQCLTDGLRKAVGSGLKGVTVQSSVALGDDKDPSLRRWKEIISTYAGGKIKESATQAAAVYMTLSALRDALDGISGDVTSASMIQKIKSMPEKTLPAAAGLGFRCNGKADPATPAVCTRGALVTTLDAKGEPTVPYRLVNATPIEG
jgi:branched-chain amino acid transport system substrate-binding protein